MKPRELTDSQLDIMIESTNRITDPSLYQTLTGERGRRQMNGNGKHRSEQPSMISASRISAVLGLDYKCSRYDCYREIAYGERKEITPFVQSLMDFGTAHESNAMEYLEQVSGELFFFTGERQKKLVRGRYSGMPDGRNASCIAEVKSRQPGEKAYNYLGDTNVPGLVKGNQLHHWQTYMPQIQQQIWLADVPVGYFACWCIDGGSRAWRIHRSEGYIKKMHEICTTFFEYLDGGEECPKRVSRKPKMPKVEFELIDGPPQEVPAAPPEITPDLIASIAAEAAQSLNEPEQLDELEETMLAEYPGEHEAILRGTARRREILTADIAF